MAKHWQSKSKVLGRLPAATPFVSALFLSSNDRHAVEVMLWKSFIYCISGLL